MSYGEKQGGREHIERTAKYLIERGGHTKDYAHKKAREVRIRAEQREDGRRK